MAKCKCGKNEMAFKHLKGMDGKWECSECPKDGKSAPKKEEPKSETKEESKEAPKKQTKKTSRRSKKTEQK